MVSLTSVAVLLVLVQSAIALATSSTSLHHSNDVEEVAKETAKMIDKVYGTGNGKDKKEYTMNAALSRISDMLAGLRQFKQQEETRKAAGTAPKKMYKTAQRGSSSLRKKRDHEENEEVAEEVVEGEPEEVVQQPEIRRRPRVRVHRLPLPKIGFPTKRFHPKKPKVRVVMTKEDLEDGLDEINKKKEEASETREQLAERMQQAEEQRRIASRNLGYLNRNGPRFVEILKKITANITELNNTMNTLDQDLAVLDEKLERLDMIEELLLKEMEVMLEAEEEGGIMKHVNHWKELGAKVLGEIEKHLFGGDGKESIMIFGFILLLVAALPCIFCVQKAKTVEREAREDRDLKRYRHTVV